MHAIILDNNNYIKEHSDKFRKPESILVDTIPDSDPAKLKCYQYINGEFVFDSDKWAEITAEREKNERKCDIESEIDSLKKNIESSDYKIIKCYEYALNNLELPYDAQKLHEERQALRNKINILEKELQEDK